MTKLIFITDNYYHIFNRGTERRIIFLEPGDYLRFVHYLYILNDGSRIDREFRRKPDHTLLMDEVGPRPLRPSMPRQCLVDIVSWVLMPNHFHLFLKQKKDNGISKFMQKLGTAETMFFNAKYKHSGVIFQGGHKAVHVKGEAQAFCLANYQHLNPVDLIEPGWKENGIKNPKKVIEFLENYRWSSYQDYIGKKNFPSVVNTDFLRGIIGPPEEFKKIIREMIFDQTKMNKFLRESKFL